MNNIKGLDEFRSINERKHIRDAFDLKTEIISALGMGARVQKHVADLRLILSELDNKVSEIKTHFSKSEAVDIIEEIQAIINYLERDIKRKTQDPSTCGVKVNTDAMVRGLEKLKDGFLGKPQQKPPKDQEQSEQSEPSENQNPG